MFSSQRFIHDRLTEKTVVRVGSLRRKQEQRIVLIGAKRWVEDCFGRSELRDQLRDFRRLEIDMTPDHRFAGSDRLRGINPVDVLARQHTPRFQIRNSDDRMLETLHADLDCTRDSESPRHMAHDWNVSNSRGAHYGFKDRRADSVINFDRIDTLVDEEINGAYGTHRSIDDDSQRRNLRRIAVQKRAQEKESRSQALPRLNFTPRKTKQGQITTHIAYRRHAICNVEGERHEIRLAGSVHVHVNKTRHDPAAASINDLRIRRCRDLLGGRHPCDAVAFNHYSLILQCLAGSCVNNGTALDDEFVATSF